jgi:hypothetical protein
MVLSEVFLARMYNASVHTHARKTLRGNQMFGLRAFRSMAVDGASRVPAVSHVQLVVRTHLPPIGGWQGAQLQR